ncbi:MAG TPA: hypothetical protein VN736_23185 [Candidatus Limnocylindrales bacterium]|nr:hypothetical protein [Candidatus Limnocylindrales bacterium]
MPASFEFLRGVLGVIGIGCSFMAGRAMIAVRRGWMKLPRMYGWIIRAVICLAAVAFRHAVDTEDYAMWGLAVAAFALGAWGASRVKPQEDLTSTIFPDRE